MASWGGREGTIQVVIVFVFLGLAFIILSLRLFTRVIVTRNHGPEDWVITAAFVGLSSSSTRRVTIPDIQTVLLYHTSSTCTCCSQRSRMVKVYPTVCSQQITP
ncbi:hypothetical protein E4T50_16580 [Aureobasidium sp. EXF-12298]|nr:hypothetical protein E4T50_16580 [Aureobasidium sp. EXF-12298]KAI4763961.1 hypothetical protein E4T51_03082 [Aureobasidium sp. EXF-12344]KAI4780005.1 hypothetical protein E4T52_05044 [Aureobasidium sp. EXF-3400]